MFTDDSEREDILSRPILSIGVDDFPLCPECGNRMETVMVNVSGQWMPVSTGADEDGPIFRAVCKDHGPWPFQVEDLDYDD